MADYPCNFVYHSSTQTVSWEGVPNSDEYLVTASDFQSGEPNQIIYAGGVETSCDFVKPSKTYYLTGRDRPKNGPWGVWGPLEPVVVP